MSTDEQVQQAREKLASMPLWRRKPTDDFSDHREYLKLHGEWLDPANCVFCAAIVLQDAGSDPPSEDRA